VPFPRPVKDDLLVKAHRHCCICHKNAGTNMEVHHIVPEVDGGDDSPENGIPLCLDCHANVEHYNAQHPRGNKFTPEELRKHRDQWFAIGGAPDWQRRPGALVPIGPWQPVRSLLDQLGKAELWNPDNRSFLGSVRALSGAERDNLIAGIVKAMSSEDERKRMDAAIVVEYLAEWHPQLVPDSLLAGMAKDDSFGVRSTAAVCFYYLASAALTRLRSENEQLRSHFSAAEPKSLGQPKPRRPKRVILLPDPLAPREPGKLEAGVLMNRAQVTLSILSKREPDVEWRTEHDLTCISEEEVCFQLGQLVSRIFGGPEPMTFRVEQDNDGRPRVRRRLVAGEPESDRFSAGYQQRLRIVDDLIIEGQAAYDASANHHAGWVLKAIDVVLAQLRLAIVLFEAGGRDWRELLDGAPPEYEPRYQVDVDQRVGM
jgi:HNH endonuclease